MPRASTKLIPHFLQYAAPDFRLDRYLLDNLLTAMPPPWPGAPVAWRHARLRRIINELAAHRPTNLAQAAMAVRIVLCRHMAADLVRRSLAHEVPDRLARGLRRTGTEMLRIAASTERMLRRRPPPAVPADDMPAADAFDLAALDAVWCRNRFPPPAPTHTPETADSPPSALTSPPTLTLPAWARQPGWRC